jgi:hypothetical protein
LAAVLALSPKLRSLLVENPSEEYHTLNDCLAVLQENCQLHGQILPEFTMITTRTDGRLLEELGVSPANLAPLGRSLLQAAWAARLPKPREFVYGRWSMGVAGEECASTESEIISILASSGISFRLESRTNPLHIFN